MELLSSSFLVITTLFSSFFIIKHCVIPYLHPIKSTKRNRSRNRNRDRNKIELINRTNNNLTMTDPDDPLVLYSKIKSKNDQLSLDAIEFIKQTIIEYNLDHISFSFNGGKDCMVLLYLIRIALKLLNKSERNLQIVWFKRSNEFPQLIEFLRYIIKKYNFPLFETCNNYRDGLEEYIKNGNPLCKSVFLGQRLTDPFCNNLHLATHCTKGWPDIMRINPILHWNYNNIWNFLTKYNLEYCCLYDKGYTSLGDIKQTIPNPLLYDRHLFTFKCAHKLLKKYQNAERLGRVITNKNKLIENNNIINDIKCLIVGKKEQIGENIINNIKLAIETSFVDEILKNKQKLNIDIEIINNDKNDEKLKWCKKHYLYTFYANILQ
eukprot:250570_1